VRLRLLSLSDTEGPSPHSFSPQIGWGRRGREKEEEERENDEMLSI